MYILGLLVMAQPWRLACQVALFCPSPLLAVAGLAAPGLAAADVAAAGAAVAGVAAAGAAAAGSLVRGLSGRPLVMVGQGLLLPGI